MPSPHGSRRPLPGQRLSSNLVFTLSAIVLCSSAEMAQVQWRNGPVGPRLQFTPRQVGEQIERIATREDAGRALVRFNRPITSD